MKRSPGKSDEAPPRPITFRAAEDLGPFELAQLWCDRTAWPIDRRTSYDELSELAVMSALAAWLRRWQPLAIHGAILAGARPEAVAGAFGETVEVTFSRGHEGAQRQRDFIMQWPGYPVLAAVREFILVTWIVSKAGEDEHTSAESRKRLNAIRTGSSRKDWDPF